MRAFLAIRKRWPLFALLALYAYLTMHMLSGQQGVVSWGDYDDSIAQLSGEVGTLKSERERLEAEADALSSKALQLDVLDQRAREMLWASREDEIVIPLPLR